MGVKRYASEPRPKSRSYPWSQSFQLLKLAQIAFVIMCILTAQPFFSTIFSYSYGLTILIAEWCIAFAATIWLGFYCSGLRWLVYSLRNQYLLWMIISISILSCFWPFSAARTGYTVIWPVGLSLAGIVFGNLLSVRDLMRALCLFFMLALAWTMLHEVSSLSNLQEIPSLLSPTGYRWSGLTPNPNILGEIAAISTAFFTVTLLYMRLNRALSIAWLAIGAFVTLRTGSATSMTMLVAGVLVVLGFMLIRRLKIAADLATLLLFISGIVITFAGYLYWSETTDLLNKDPTASGRVSVWVDALEIVARYPWFGLGYGAVWGMGSRTFLPEYESTLTVDHAHNGYLQIATELGVPATGILVAFLLIALVRSIGRFSRQGSGSALFATAFLVMSLVGNVAEAGLFMPSSFSWLLMVTLSGVLARPESDQRRRRPGSRRKRPHPESLRRSTAREANRSEASAGLR